MDKLVPDKYYKSIYDIDYKQLKKSGIKYLIFDISNTLVPENAKEPNKRVKDLFEDLKNMNFKIILMSNNIKREVAPFKELLCVDSCYLSFKPLKHKYKKIIKTFDIDITEIACIGDQIFFDILGANRMKITSILVNPISADMYAVSKFNRRIETFAMNHLTKKDLFKRGRYYE